METEHVVDVVSEMVSLELRLVRRSTIHLDLKAVGGKQLGGSVTALSEGNTKSTRYSIVELSVTWTWRHARQPNSRNRCAARVSA